MRYDPGTDSYTDYAERLRGVDLRKVRAICEDSAGDVWIGHEKGVVVASPDGKGDYSFVAAGGLEALDVSDITEDGRGNVWIGTSQGLYLCGRDGRKSPGGAADRRYSGRCGAFRGVRPVGRALGEP